MALNAKYAGLPDVDSAPGVYETPSLTDGGSTVPTTTAQGHSDDEFYDIEDETENFSRSRLRPGEARSRFSDRVDGLRKSYKVTGRRHRILEDGTDEYGDLSDDDDEEGLERKIARLKREVELAKDDYAKRKAASAAATGETETSEVTLESLSQVLDDISRPEGISNVSAVSKAKPPVTSSSPEEDAEAPAGERATYTVTYAPTYEQSHALAKAADFDRRLLMLERGLGVGSSSAPEAGANGLPRAVLPTLDTLEKHISTLAQASTSNLDAISRRVRNLASEQDKLNDSKERARALREELGKQGSSPPSEESEQEARINALYGILPTIESLTPMLPSLLDRLRSLRAIHADAATASQTLDRIEKQQLDMTGEMKQWRDGLERVEGAIKEGDTSVKGNMKVMEGWVKDLEERMAKLT